MLRQELMHSDQEIEIAIKGRLPHAVLQMPPVKKVGWCG